MCMWREERRTFQKAGKEAWFAMEENRERERETVKGKQNEVKRGGIYNQVKKERKIILMRTHQKAKEKSEGQEMDRERGAESQHNSRELQIIAYQIVLFFTGCLILFNRNLKILMKFYIYNHFQYENKSQLEFNL